MKKISVIITVAILSATLASCADYNPSRMNYNTDLDAIVGGSKEFTVDSANAGSASDTGSKESAQTTSGKTKMKTVTYTPHTYLENFSSVKAYSHMGDAPALMFSIPETWECVGGGDYMIHHDNTSYYSSAFEIGELIKVDSDFVINRSIIAKYNAITDNDSISDNSKMTAGKTYTGYKYVSFTSESRMTGEYSMHAFIRVSPVNIVHISFILPSDLSVMAERVLHSVKLSKS